MKDYKVRAMVEIEVLPLNLDECQERLRLLGGRLADIARQSRAFRRLRLRETKRIVGDIRTIEARVRWLEGQAPE
jgi:hypothetical protein